MMVDDCVDQMEKTLKKLRQSESLLDSFDRLNRLGESPEGLPKVVLEAMVEPYDSIELEQLLSFVEEVIKPKQE